MPAVRPGEPPRQACPARTPHLYHVSDRPGRTAMMQFERAIHDASTLFLFDRRSQQQLQEMAEAAAPRSRDRYLIRLSQAAFLYYNSLEAGSFNMRGAIRQALGILKEVKRFREDRSFYTIALRLEVDLLLHASRLTYEETDRAERMAHLFNEEDSQALLICETLLKNLPVNLDPMPNSWYTSLIPLFPPYRDQVLRFYADRVKDNRIEALQLILKQIRAELVTIAGIIQTKKFLVEESPNLKDPGRVRNLITAAVGDITLRLKERIPALLQVTQDVSLPKGITRGQLELAVKTMEERIQKAKAEKDVRQMTAHLLHLGILHFLNEAEGEAVKTLVNTLRASAKISPEDKKSRQNRHDEFPDIPFMTGTAFLKEVLAAKGIGDDERIFLRNSKVGLLRALQLQPRYHQAYVNLLLTLALSGDDDAEAVIRLYLSHFERDLTRLNGLAFRNQALLEYRRNNEALSPESVRWLLISSFCAGGELTKAKKMLQELKTLYVLNAHDYVVGYLQEYRSLFRTKDPEFIADLEDNGLHSAMLFYLAHGFASLSLVQGKNEAELHVNHENLDQSIDLNAEALYFNPRNTSALRLVDTQNQVLDFSRQQTERRWENINTNIGQRFQYYEDYLRQVKSYGHLRERMLGLDLEGLVPEFRISPAVIQRMESTITAEQRERLKHRVGLA